MITAKTNAVTAYKDGQALPLMFLGGDTSGQDIISDAWVSSKSYAVGDFCIYDNKLWKCKVTNTGQEPVEGEHWTMTSVASEIKMNKVYVTTKSYNNVPITTKSSAGAYYSGNFDPPSYPASAIPLSCEILNWGGFAASVSVCHPDVSRIFFTSDISQTPSSITIRFVYLAP